MNPVTQPLFPFNTMNTRLFSLFSFALISALPAALPAADYRVELPPEAAAGILVVSGIGGDVTIEGIDGSEFIATSSGGGNRSAVVPRPPEPPKPRDLSKPREGLRSLLDGGEDNSGLGVQIHVENREVHVTSVRPHDGDDFVFKIPRAMSVRVNRGLNGDVSVTGVDGELELMTTDGDVRVTGASSPVVVHAVNGDVHLAFAAFPRDRPSSVNAVNGTVVVELPADSRVEMDLKTINGDIFTDLPVEVKDRKVMGFGGPRSVQSTLNGGGAALKIMSVNDDVIVRAPKVN